MRGVLETLVPDLIVTQDFVHVCALLPTILLRRLRDSTAAGSALLNPQDLGDVWRDILWVGEETCHGSQAEALLEKIGARLGVLEQQIDSSKEAPARRVFSNGCNRSTWAATGSGNDSTRGREDLFGVRARRLSGSLPNM